MKWGKVVICLLLALYQVPAPVAYASNAGGVVFSHIIVGETGNSSSEFIAIYNNSENDIDVTDYCVQNKSLKTIACIAADANTKVYIRAHGYLTFASISFVSLHGYTPDTSFDSSNDILQGGDSLTLINGQDVEVDKVTWGTSGGGSVPGQMERSCEKRIQSTVNNWSIRILCPMTSRHRQCLFIPQTRHMTS